MKLPNLKITYDYEQNFLNNGFTITINTAALEASMNSHSKYLWMTICERKVNCLLLLSVYQDIE